MAICLLSPEVGSNVWRLGWCGERLTMKRLSSLKKVTLIETNVNRNLNPKIIQIREENSQKYSSRLRRE